MSNQIPFLHPSKRTPGAVYHWKPSARLRAGGWQNLRLGTDWNAAIAAAIARNSEVAAWQAGGAAAPIARAAPRRWRWRDLVARYTAEHKGEWEPNPAWLRLKPKSRAEYRSCIKALTVWAEGGELRLDMLDRTMVMDLKEALANDPRRHRMAALFRILNILLGFAFNKGMMPVMVGGNLQIAKPGPRTRRVRRDLLAPLLASADALGFGHVRLGILLGFYTMQREGDLLAATGFQIRPVEDLSALARKALAGPDGKVRGLWLQQEKTGAWVAVSLAPAARIEVEAILAARRAAGGACTHLITCRGEDRPCPEWRFQRDFRAVVSHATEQATLRQDHALAAIYAGDPGRRRDALQFRDLRRSGMCWLRELGVSVGMIASISGHSIQETQKILDTYMPADTHAAAEGMALGVHRQAERDAEAAAEEEAK
jgi:hypothetical protein